MPLKIPTNNGFKHGFEVVQDLVHRKRKEAGRGLLKKKKSGGAKAAGGGRKGWTNQWILYNIVLSEAVDDGTVFVAVSHNASFL